MKTLRKLTGALLCLSALLSFTSCGELMEELFGDGEEDSIQCNFSTALAGKWRVVAAGDIENVPEEMAHVREGGEVPCSLEWIEFSNGQAHFHFSQPVTLDYLVFGGSGRPSTTMTDYTCTCELDGSGFHNFVFGFRYDSDRDSYVETYTEYDMGDTGEIFYSSVRQWAYGKDEDYATTLVLYGTNAECVDFGYEMKRYDD